MVVGAVSGYGVCFVECPALWVVGGFIVAYGPFLPRSCVLVGCLVLLQCLVDFGGFLGSLVWCGVGII